MNDQLSLKRSAAKKALEFVQEGMTLGLGTGTTAEQFIIALGEKVKEGLKIKGCPTSMTIAKLALKHKIPLVSLNNIDALDLTVDGCDQFDEQKRLIKGLGGALLREKIVASIAKQLVIIADDSKRRKKLGQGVVPIEVVPVADLLLLRQVQKLGFEAKLRKKGDSPFVTDNQNHIIDLYFPEAIKEVQTLEKTLVTLPGVVETGLFLHFSPTLIIASNKEPLQVIT